MKPRQLIQSIITDFDKRHGNLDQHIDFALQNERIDHRDRRFIFEIVYGVIRRRLTLDFIIDHFLTDQKYRKMITLRRILEAGVYQIMFMDRVPDHAAVNESVDLAKEDPKVRPMAGVVNAVLRNVIKSKRTIPYPDARADLVERLSIEFSHPRWMIERWLAVWGLSKTKQLLTFNNEKPDIYFRRRMRDISRQQFETEARAVCDMANGYLNLYYRLKKNLSPENIRLLQQGLCTVQSPSSGWAVAMAEPSKGECIVDLCSAPGGKSTLISEVMAGTGMVVACEIKWNRLMDVVEVTRRLELGTIYTVLCDASKPPFCRQFDKVLLDAPCTGTGVLHRHPEARWLRTTDDITRLSALQSKLLESAAGLVKDDGILVYSTCSLEPEENEAQIDSFLKRHQNFTIDKAPGVIPGTYTDLRGFLRITPHEHGLDGMFAARLRKLAS
jgi:16S rRNA (cytosine967-C5)-methyltransferase